MVGIEGGSYPIGSADGRRRTGEDTHSCYGLRIAEVNLTRENWSGRNAGAVARSF
jgi:hypothetical protein